MVSEPTALTLDEIRTQYLLRKGLILGKVPGFDYVRVTRWATDAEMALVKLFHAEIWPAVAPLLALVDWMMPGSLPDLQVPAPWQLAEATNDGISIVHESLSQVARLISSDDGGLNERVPRDAVAAAVLLLSTPANIPPVLHPLWDTEFAPALARLHGLGERLHDAWADVEDERYTPKRTRAGDDHNTAEVGEPATRRVLSEAEEDALATLWSDHVEHVLRSGPVRARLCEGGGFRPGSRSEAHRRRVEWLVQNEWNRLAPLLALQVNRWPGGPADSHVLPPYLPDLVISRVEYALEDLASAPWTGRAAPSRGDFAGDSEWMTNAAYTVDCYVAIICRAVAGLAEHEVPPAVQEEIAALGAQAEAQAFYRAIEEVDNLWSDDDEAHELLSASRAAPAQSAPLPDLKAECAPQALRNRPWNGELNDGRPLFDEANAAHLALAPFDQMAANVAQSSDDVLTVTGYAIDALRNAYALARRAADAALYTARHGHELLQALEPHVPDHLRSDFAALRWALTPDRTQ